MLRRMLRMFCRPVAVLWVLMLGACSTSGGGGDVGPASKWVPDYRDSDKPIVVLGFFKMSCRACHDMGPHMRELYELARQRGLLSKIDFYAYGSRTTPFECYQYQRRHQVPYPVISDYSRTIARRFGRLRLPQVIVLERRDGALVEKTRIRYLRGDKEALLERILR